MKHLLVLAAVLAFVTLFAVLTGCTENVPASTEDRQTEQAEVTSRNDLDETDGLQTEKAEETVLNGPESFAGRNLSKLELRLRYPDYFTLPTAKGLEVYVHCFENDCFGYGLMLGTNRNKTLEEIKALPLISAEELKTVLSAYSVDGFDKNGNRIVVGMYIWKVEGPLDGNSKKDLIDKIRAQFDNQYSVRFGIY